MICDSLVSLYVAFIKFDWVTGSTTVRFCAAYPIPHEMHIKLPISQTITDYWKFK